MAKVVFAQKRIDPESIFPLESFCNIDEGKILLFFFFKAINENGLKK